MKKNIEDILKQIKENNQAIIKRAKEEEIEQEGKKEVFEQQVQEESLS